MIKLLNRTAQYCFVLYLFIHIGLAQAEAPPPKPTLNVSFSKPVIREDDSISVEVLFASEQAEISQASLRIISLPGFVSSSDGPCGEKTVVDSRQEIIKYPLEPRQGNSEGSIDNVRSRSLCFRTGSDSIRIGDYNVLFVVDYQWVRSGKTYRSVVSLEKILKVNFFGSDSVAGVPFALAGLVVPGLFFWLTLRLFGVSWGIDLALGDKLIYSMIISLGFIGVAFTLKSFTSAGFLSYLDISDGISVGKLVSLAITGVVVGFVVVVIWVIVRNRQVASEKDARIYKDDLAEECVRKLLKRNPVYNPSWRRRFTSLFISENQSELEVKIVTKAAFTFTGALGAQESDFTVLVGWHSIKCPSDHPDRAQLEKLEKKRRLYELFTTAKRLGLPIGLVDSIKQKAADSDESSSGNDVMTWNNDDVTQITRFPKQRKNVCLSLEIV